MALKGLAVIYAKSNVKKTNPNEPNFSPIVRIQILPTSSLKGVPKRITYVPKGTEPKRTQTNPIPATLDNCPANKTGFTQVFMLFFRFFKFLCNKTVTFAHLYIEDNRHCMS